MPTTPGPSLSLYFGLQRLTTQQSTDLYELIIARHRKSRFAITSNWAVEEWLGVFDDPVTRVGQRWWFLTAGDISRI
ncbi:MAG: hypothetical protein R6U89_07660 [Dehalococcoidia bacterium]